MHAEGALMGEVHGRLRVHLPQFEELAWVSSVLSQLQRPHSAGQLTSCGRARCRTS